MGGSPNDGVNVAAGMSGHAVAVEMACRRITTQSFAQKRIKWRSLKDLAIAKAWFSMWKSCKTMAWTWGHGKGQKKAIPAEWAADMVDLGCRWFVLAGEHGNANVYKELLRQHVFS
jgi:hypothetical protein